MTSHRPFRLQSAHTLFSGRLTSSRRVRVKRSVVALSGFDILKEVVNVGVCLEAVTAIEMWRPLHNRDKHTPGWIGPGAIRSLIPNLEGRLPFWLSRVHRKTICRGKPGVKPSSLSWHLDCKEVRAILAKLVCPESKTDHASRQVSVINYAELFY